MNQATSRTVLLTGAQGFLGRAIQRLAPAGIQLIPTDLSDSSEMSDHTPRWFRALNILNATENDFDGVDVVIHNAGLFDLTASRTDLMKVNVEGSNRLATAAVRAGVKHFVQVSSTSIYGPRKPPIAEDTSEKTPIHHYGESKWLGENESMAACEAAQVRWTAIRPTLIYGPGSRYGIAPFVAALHACAQRGIRPFLPANGPQSHVVHVDDVARAIWHSVNHQLEGAYNVADETPAAFGDMLMFIAAQLNVRYRRLPLPWALARVVLTRPALIKPVLKLIESSMQRSAETAANPNLIPIRLDEDWGHFLAADYVFDTKRLSQTGFSYRYPDTNKGLIETIKWYREHQWV
jgi:2-alkyl-3-oxoalkanoate reductase